MTHIGWLAFATISAISATCALSPAFAQTGEPSAALTYEIFVDVCWKPFPDPDSAAAAAGARKLVRNNSGTWELNPDDSRLWVRLDNRHGKLCVLGSTANVNEVISAFEAPNTFQRRTDIEERNAQIRPGIISRFYVINADRFVQIMQQSYDMNLKSGSGTQMIVMDKLGAGL